MRDERPTTKEGIYCYTAADTVGVATVVAIRPSLLCESMVSRFSNLCMDFSLPTLRARLNRSMRASLCEQPEARGGGASVQGGLWGDEWPQAVGIYRGTEPCIHLGAAGKRELERFHEERGQL